MIFRGSAINAVSMKSKNKNIRWRYFLGGILSIGNDNEKQLNSWRSKNQ